MLLCKKWGESEIEMLNAECNVGTALHEGWKWHRVIAVSAFDLFLFRRYRGYRRKEGKRMASLTKLALGVRDEGRV
jgi:hypothetical protein